MSGQCLSTVRLPALRFVYAPALAASTFAGSGIFSVSPSRIEDRGDVTHDRLGGQQGEQGVGVQAAPVGSGGVGDIYVGEVRDTELAGTVNSRFVARRARTSLATIYKRYSTRDELILAALHSWMDEHRYADWSIKTHHRVSWSTTG